jgi:mannose-6-phosphate isomerase-like protein (cupin superfamily)
MGKRRAAVFHADSIGYHPVPWGQTKTLIGRDAPDSSCRSDRVLVKITENAATPDGAHRMHTHDDQEEILYVLEGHGENVGEDGTIREFGPGDVIYVPAGVPHEDRSNGREAVKFLVVKVPPDN